MGAFDTLGASAMHPYALLGFAIFAEVVGTAALKVSDGMTRLGPAALVVGGYGLSFWLLSLTLITMPVGLVYAIWSGVGVAAIALIGQYYFEVRIFDFGLGVGYGDDYRGDRGAADVGRTLLI